MSTGPLSRDSAPGLVSRVFSQAPQASAAPSDQDGAVRRSEQDAASVFRGQPSELKLEVEQHAGNSRSASRASRG